MFVDPDRLWGLLFGSIWSFPFFLNFVDLLCKIGNLKILFFENLAFYSFLFQKYTSLRLILTSFKNKKTFFIFLVCEMEILEIILKIKRKKNKSQFTAIFYVKYSLLIQYMKMYISEVYVYQRISLQHWKRREKLSFTLGTPILGYPVSG